MSLRIRQLSDNIRLAVLDGGLTAYVLPDNKVALASKDKVIAGATLFRVHGLDRKENWYKINTLWADSAVASITILYFVLEHYKYVLPSFDISPAARAVLTRFYKKYKGTEVVIEGVSEDYSGEIGAGYVWSPKLRKVPVQIGTIENHEEMRRLKDAISNGFDRAYTDAKRTKRNPDFLLSRGEIFSLYNLLVRGILMGGPDKYEALSWIGQHAEELEVLNNSYANKLLLIYEADKKKQEQDNDY